MERGTKAAISVFAVLTVVGYLIDSNLVLDFYFATISGFIAFGVKRATGWSFTKASAVCLFGSMLVPFFALLLYFQYVAGFPPAQTGSLLSAYMTLFVVERFPSVLVGILGGVVSDSTLAVLGLSP